MFNTRKLFHKPNNFYIQCRWSSTLKAVNMRFKSLQNIKKVTMSMKMVAAAKFARAEQNMTKLKGLSNAIRNFFDKSKIKLDPTLPRQLIVYISSDRGLCGSAHSGIFRMLRNEFKTSKADFKLVIYGEKGRNLMRLFFKEHFLFVVSEAGKKPPTFRDAARVADQICRSDFDYQTGKIAYNKFTGKMSVAPSTIPITHFNILKEHEMLYRFQDISMEDLRSFVEFVLATQLYSVIVENSAAEQCSRMLAMDGSSKSAGDIIRKLGLLYNRTRQAVITKELNEIISGASALQREE